MTALAMRWALAAVLSVALAIAFAISACGGRQRRPALPAPEYEDPAGPIDDSPFDAGSTET
jgi:hypothetical protein